MTIGIISSMRGYSWAGSEEGWYACALAALNRGDQVRLFLHRDLAGARQVQELQRMGAKLSIWDVSRFSRWQQVKDRFLPTFPPSCFDECDVLLVSLGAWLSALYTPGLTASLARGRVPFVLFCQFNSDHLAFSSGERAELRAFMERSAACVFVSQQNLEVTRRQFAVEPKNAVVIPNRSREHRREPLPWPEPADPLRMACVARFEVLWKGQDLLLEVLRNGSWRERRWHLNFYGEGPDLEHLMKLTRFFQLEKRVSFRGHVSDLNEIWSRNHLLVLPSHGEGTPLAILEAMMFGRPVVTTDVGGNCEVIEDDVTGFIAKAPTPRSFGEALERAWQATPDLPRTGRVAHERVLACNEVEPGKRLFEFLSRHATKL